MAFLEQNGQWDTILVARDIIIDASKKYQYIRILGCFIYSLFLFKYD